jgi:ABC-2 type transport system permease protein
MTGFRAFLWKEFVEIRRTWRIWVIPGMLVFFGVTSPIVAALTPALVRSMAASAPGVVIHIPPPTALDAYGQLLKNLNQFVLIAVIITGAAAVSGERSSGTAILALTKPLSRRAFLLAKILSQVTLLVAATVLGAAACLAVTAAVFGVAHPARVATAMVLWLLYASLLIVMMTLFSAAFRSRGAAAGAGLGFYFLSLLLSAWGPAARYSFLGLMSAMRDALMGEAVSSGWPVATAVAAIVVGVVAALGTFERQEL